LSWLEAKPGNPQTQDISINHITSLQGKGVGDSSICVKSHQPLAVCAAFYSFQNTINFDFSPKIGQDIVKHKKVVWGDGSYMSH
jgi:hypothetical protein